jgi:hypothetical protein
VDDAGNLITARVGAVVVADDQRVGAGRPVVYSIPLAEVERRLGR